MTVVRRSPLEKIEALTARLAELEADRERAVATAMERGATWAEIGEALGVTAQAAHKRYRWLRHSPLTGECWYEPPLAGVTRRARG
jgi:DNA-directed RNA polymerase specialized sigma24 family protein